MHSDAPHLHALHIYYYVFMCATFGANFFIQHHLQMTLLIGLFSDFIILSRIGCLSTFKHKSDSRDTHFNNKRGMGLTSGSTMTSFHTNDK